MVSERKRKKKTGSGSARREPCQGLPLNLELLEDRVVPAPLKAMILGLPPGGYVDAGSPVNLQGEVTGGTGSPGYSWQLLQYGVPVETGTGATFSFTPTDSDPYQISLTATESGGATATAMESVAAQVATPAFILNDEGPSFVGTGAGWTSVQVGYNGEPVQSNVSAPGAASASWQVSGVTTGSYLVQATWNGSASNTPDAVYQIYNGSTLLQSVPVNQQQSPSGPLFGGVAFQTLATVPLTSGTIRVVLVNQHSGDVEADAVRIAPLRQRRSARRRR